MSTDTKSTLKDGEVNPGQVHSDEMFMSHPDLKDMDDRLNENGDPRDRDAARGALQRGEDRAANTKMGGSLAGKASEKAAGAAAGALTGGNAVAKAAAEKVIARLKTKSGAATGVVAVLIILGLVGLGILSPSAILLRLKEEGTSWMTKYTNIGVNDRMRKVVGARMFGDPTAHNTSKALSRFYPGLSDKEIERIRSIPGIGINDSDIATKDGKKFLKQMTFTENGKINTITDKNFADFHAKNVAFRSAFNTQFDAKSMTFRTKGSLKKFSSFGVDRSKPLGELMSKEGILKFFREKFYGAKNKFSVLNYVNGEEDPNMTEADKARAAQLSGLDLNTEASGLLGTDVIADGPKAMIPDVAGLTPEGAIKTAWTTGSKTFKGALLGVLASIDSYCAVYNTIRIINFGVKALAAAQLIRYAALFLTIADKQKAAEISSAEIAFLANVLLRPSSVPESKGKDFSRSQGASLIFDKKVSHPDDLSRFSLGNVATQALSKVFEIFNFGNISPELCSRVMSWWGQLTLMIVGLASSILTLGTGAIEGAAIGVAQGLAFSYIQQVLTPKLIPLIAGTIIPDPLKDPEGGYGAGNAIAAGLGAFGGQLGRSKGMRPLTKQQFAILQNSNEASTMAAVQTYNYNQMGLFNLENPRSLPNILAYNLNDLTQPKQSLSDYVASARSLIASATSVTTTPTSALSPDDEYRGVYCADEVTNSVMQTSIGLDFARDANCNIIYGPDPATLSVASLGGGSQVASTGSVLAANDGKFSIDNTVRWMSVENHYIDPNTLEPLGEYKEYLDTCVNGDEPIIDKFAADLSTSTTMEPCYSLDEKYQYFSVYAGLDEVLDGVNASGTDTLGKASADTAATTGGGTTPTTPTGATPSGTVQQLAQQIIALKNAGKIRFNVLNARDISNRSTPELQITDIAAGKLIGITTRCNFTIASPITADPRPLQFIIDVANQYKTGTFQINSIYGQCHSPTSDHYDGTALDTGCPFDSALGDSIAPKYSMLNNMTLYQQTGKAVYNESCANQAAHFHYGVH
jgi:hypothetical protein